MKRWIALLALLLGVSLPAAAQLQYFGYVLGGEDDASLALNKSYTNFTHVVSTTPQDAAFIAKVNNINARGLKVTIDLGQIFFLGPAYVTLQSNWQQRWSDWKSYNAGILTSDKVLALTVHDEPLFWGASMSDVETAAAYIKSDPNLSWLKIFSIEAPCKVYLDNCGGAPFNHGFANATPNIPHVDWLGLDIYYTHPSTDWVFLPARDMVKAKYPGKKWVYIMDGWWTDTHAVAFAPNPADYMATIADEWYGMANADSDAVLLGVFRWPTYEDGTGSADLGPNVLGKHVSIGRTITGKHRGPLIGSFSINTYGVLTGWACDTGQAVSDANPLVDIMVDGGMWRGIMPPYEAGSGTWFDMRCGNEQALGISIALPSWSKGKSVSLVGYPIPGTIPSTCPQTPACTW